MSIVHTVCVTCCLCLPGFCLKLSVDNCWSNHLAEMGARGMEECVQVRLGAGGACVMECFFGECCLANLIDGIEDIFVWKNPQ